MIDFDDAEQFALTSALYVTLATQKEECERSVIMLARRIVPDQGITDSDAIARAGELSLDTLGSHVSIGANNGS